MNTNRRLPVYIVVNEGIIKKITVLSTFIEELKLFSNLFDLYQTYYDIEEHFGEDEETLIGKPWKQEYDKLCTKLET
jgi:hypothetical protein